MEQHDQEAALAQTVFENELPNLRHRRAVLQLLLSSVKKADAVAPNAWAVTLFRDGLRLNVGQVEVLVVGHEYVGLNCVGSVESSFASGHSCREVTYKSMPQPHFRLDTKAAELDRLGGALLEAHHQFVETAARSPSGQPRKGTVFRKSHCEGLVQYATEFVGANVATRA